jgi:hypothetical protein
MILHPQIALCLARDRAQELHQAAACRRLRRPARQARPEPARRYRTEDGYERPRITLRAAA